MAKKGIIKKTFGPAFRFRKALDWDQTVENTKFLASLFKGAFKKPQPAKLDKDFSEATARLGINEQELLDRQQRFFQIAIIFLLFGLGLFGYALYLFIEGHFFVGLFCTLLVVLLLANAYRYHLWYIQIKFKKLGLCFKEWLYHTLGGKKEL